MKKIAVISTGYLWFPCEAGTLRVFDICMALTKAGYLVDTFVPDFQHHTKLRRDMELIESQKYPLRIIPIYAPSYKKNIGIGRVFSNMTLSRNIKGELAARIGEYDAVFVSVPPNDVAAGVVDVCKKAGVPCLVDIEDLWPEAMSMVIKNENLGKLIFQGFLRDVEYVYSNCNAVSGTSEDYTQRAFLNNPDREIPSVTAHVGVDIEAFDTNVSVNAEEIAKPKGEFWVTYAGSLSNSYDIMTLIKAAEIIENTNHPNIRFKILGSGVNADKLKAYTERANLESVGFLGFVPYPKTCAYLKTSDVLINSFVSRAPQSIVNKVGDYFAAGKPVINSLKTQTFTDIVKKNKVGINIEPENPGELASAILELYGDFEKREDMGNRARSLCEKKFDRNKENKKLVKLLASIIEKQ